jgi:hypothetical protein
MVTNREAGIHFRNRVLIYLLNFGLRATDPFQKDRLSELVGDPAVFTDIGGLEPWIIDIRTSQKSDISSALNEAKAAARATGSDWYVTIMSRRGRSIEDAYAVVPLQIMARIFAGQNPTSELRVGRDELGRADPDSPAE